VKPLLGWVCFAISLASVVAFEYTLHALVGVGTCSNGRHYGITRPCPPQTAGLIAGVIAYVFVAIGAAIGTKYFLATWPLLVIWAALFVPLGIGFGIGAHDNPHVAIVFYGLAALFVFMGLFPLLYRGKPVSIRRSRY
jgi:hypothetical protein